jgi:hypothetical protein
LLLGREAGETHLHWQDAVDGSVGGNAFDVVRSGDPANFLTATTCLIDSQRSDTTAVDPAVPDAGTVFYYAVRATNACPDGVGALGRRSNGVPRPARDCP